MAGPAAAAWIAIGAAGRTAAKKYGALIARKMFPKLFKKVDPKKVDPKKEEWMGKEYSYAKEKEKVKVMEKGWKKNWSEGKQFDGSPKSKSKPQTKAEIQKKAALKNAKKSGASESSILHPKNW